MNKPFTLFQGEFATEAEWRDAVMGCSGQTDTCVVHGEKRQKRNRWSYIDSPELLEKVGGRKVEGKETSLSLFLSLSLSF